jgi:hypothetical protein
MGPMRAATLEGYPLSRRHHNTALDLVRARRHQPTTGPESAAALAEAASAGGPGTRSSCADGCGGRWRR